MQTELVEAVPVATGEIIANSIINNLESDLTLAVHRRALAAAQNRLRLINGDFQRLIGELNANYSDVEAGLVRMAIQGSRNELINCYIAVQPIEVRTPSSRLEISKLVDSILSTTLAGIKPVPAIQAGDKHPTKPRRGSTASA